MLYTVIVCYSYISLHFLRTLSKIILFNCGFVNFVRVNNNCAKTTLAFSTDRSWTAPNCQMQSSEVTKFSRVVVVAPFKNKSTTGIGIIDRLDQCLKIERPIPKTAKKNGSKSHQNRGFTIWDIENPFFGPKPMAEPEPKALVLIHPRTQLLALFRRLKDFEDLYQQQGCLWQMARSKTLEATEWIWHTNSKYMAYGPQFAASALEIFAPLAIQGRVWEKVLTPKWWDRHSRNSNQLNSSTGRKYKALQLIHVQGNNTDQDKIHTRLFGWK